jgi:translation initiation factor eIF-2B subunit delta
VQADIPCSYAFLSGISYTMREVSKVMLGAAAVLSNGTVLGRAGSAAVAMCAAASSKVRPVPLRVCVHGVPA